MFSTAFQMRPSEFDFGPGRVHYWALEDVVDADPARDPDAFREDLAQVVFEGADVTLDVGWYPAGDPLGSFVVVLVRGDDWDEPIFSACVRTAEQLRSTLLRAAARVSDFGV